MKRLGTSLAAAMTVAIAANVAVTAQDAGTPVCVVVDGALPVGGWDADGLATAIAAGDAQITVVDPGECVEPEPVPEPSSDEPMPVEMVEQGLSVDGENVNYAVLLRNPNPSTWVADLMSYRVDILDKNGDLVTTSDGYVDVLPGQTVAVVDTEYDAKGASSMEVAIANGDRDWEEIDFVPGDLEFTTVKNKKGKYSSKTIGRVESLFEDQVEGVEINSVYRDKAGDILGGGLTYVDFIPGGGSASFEISIPDEIPFRRIDSTEIYYEL